MAKHVFEKPNCRLCNKPTRRKYVTGVNSQRSKSQHPRFRVCQNGHDGYFKRGQV